MKRFLLLSVAAMLSSAAAFSQAVSTAQNIAEAKALSKTAIAQTAIAQKDAMTAADITVNQAPRKAYADGVLMMRPEGTFFNTVSLSNGNRYSSVLMPPFAETEFYNLCTDKASAVWSINGNELEANENGNLDYYIGKGSSSLALYYAPTITVGDVSHQVVDFVQPIDSVAYGFYYLNTRLSGYWYSTDGSPFMTEDIPWDFDGDGTAEPNTMAGIRQLIAEKPVAPLVLSEVYFPFFSTQEVAVPEDQVLTLIINRINVTDDGYLVLGDTLAVMETTGADIEAGGEFTDGFYEFGATFASYTEDEFGTLTANPIILDDMFAITILGFDGKDVSVQTFWADQSRDEASFYSGMARPTLIVCHDERGQESGTLRYYGNTTNKYCYNAIFVLIGETDGMEVVDSTADQVAPAEGTEETATADEDASPAYLYTNFPIYDYNGENYTWAENYAFEGVPEWAEVGIWPGYYENAQYTNVRGLNMIYFAVEPLPEGEKGRIAEVTPISVRGAQVNMPIRILQGDVEDLLGVTPTLVYDAKGNYKGAYNLNGQQVSEAAAKGIVVKDGKKLFVK